MADGSVRAIDEIEVGDEVTTWDETTGNMTTSVVTKVYVHASPGQLSVINDRLRATPNHPMYVDGTWRRADTIGSDSALMQLSDGRGALLPTTASVLRTEAHEGLVYNLEVDGTHTYFAEGILVHNK